MLSVPFISLRGRVPLFSPKTYSVQISIRVLWHVVVEHDVDPLDIHPSAKQVGGHQYPPLEVLELLVPGKPGERGVEGAHIRAMLCQHTCKNDKWGGSVEYF